jgi:hypothetical protein
VKLLAHTVLSITGYHAELLCTVPQLNERYLCRMSDLSMAIYLKKLEGRQQDDDMGGVRKFCL